MKKRLLILLACGMSYMAPTCLTDLVDRFQPERCGLFFDDGIQIETDC